MPRYLTEFVGTYFLVLIIALSVVSGTELVAVSVGLGLTALVYMGGHISGAHYNPAVTLAFALRGVTPRSEILPYIGAQLLGSVFASITTVLLTRGMFVPAPGMGFGGPAVLAAECLFTFLLMLVILNVAIDPRMDGNPTYGVAIGFVVAAGIFAVGGVSGAVFNPAVGIGPILVDALHGGSSLGHLWYYLAGPVAGALVAVPVYRLQERGVERMDLQE